MSNVIENIEQAISNLLHIDSLSKFIIETTQRNVINDMCINKKVECMSKEKRNFINNMEK